MATIRPRRAGVLIPTFAIRTEGDLGIGDTRGVREMIDWAADTGLGFLQFLPINATGSDPSPYNAISSVALDFLTLDLHPEAVPEVDAAFFAETTTRADVANLRAGPVQYERVRALKDALLRHAFARLRGTTKRGREFAKFRAEEAAWLEDFCLFRVLMSEHGHEDWTSWPETLNTAAKARAWLEAQRSGNADARKGNAKAIDTRLRFHAFVQWLCFTQWRAIRAHAASRGVRLMGDVPFGISWCSAEVFFHPEQFDLDWCGGAPPETYFKDDIFVQRWGQNWGIPLYRWDVMERDGFAWWRQRVGKLTEVFDIFRIDHTLGFYRIYSFPWRPKFNADFLPLSDDEARARTGGRYPHFQPHDDETPEHRAANLATGNKYLRMIVAAAAPQEVVAEDLGVVPEYVRPHLLSLDVPGFKISHWESDGHDHVALGRDYDNCAFTTYATHDHEPMKTHWEHRRRDANDEAAPDRWLGNKELRFLAQFAGLPVQENHWPAYDDTIRHALLEALLTSNARFSAFMLTDLFALEDRFNVPGIESGKNWSARMPMTVGEMRTRSPWQAECEWLAEAVRRTGRSDGAAL